MSKIRIKNFGPIGEGFNEDGGWMDIKKVTVFIGDQGSGKSTVAKLIAMFSWMEKTLNRGEGSFVIGRDIQMQAKWHGLDTYFHKNRTEIEYIGDRYAISYKPNLGSGAPVIDKIQGEYMVPKIAYIPDQRNFLSTIKTAFDVTGLPRPLEAFAQKFKKAQLDLQGQPASLPLNGFAYEYDEQQDTSYVVSKGNKTDLLVASSGLQSIIPLYLVTNNLSAQIATEKDPANALLTANQSIRRDAEISAIMRDNTLTNEQKIRKTDDIFARYHNKRLINIVEEPEQNLYPTSQRELLNSLTACNNRTLSNTLIMTTHSPYLINYITLAVKAHMLLAMCKKNSNGAKYTSMVKAIVPEDAVIAPDELVIYELDKTGTIRKLDNYNGIPSDENYLNEQLGATNELFAQLLEIQQQL